jgi:hypothetical protein
MNQLRAFFLVVGTLLVAACGGDSSTNSYAPGSQALGKACNSATDCATGLKCATEDPHGQCYKECTPSKDADCGDTTKYACSFEGHCYLKCNSTSDCTRASEGYVCKDDMPARNVKFCDVGN